MRTVALYEHGEIGKSTTAQNKCTALAVMNKEVMVTGNPNANATYPLLGGVQRKSLLETLYKAHKDIELEEIIRVCETKCVNGHSTPLENSSLSSKDLKLKWRSISAIGNMPHSA